MKLLHITNNYPTRHFPIFGIFVKEQIESLSKIGIESEVFFINGKEKGKIEYLKSIFRLRKILKTRKIDIVHCHHAFSAIVFLGSGLAGRYPSIVSFQNDPKDESFLNLFKILKNHTTFWIFKNNSVYADKIRGYYLPNGVDVDFFKPIDKIEVYKKLGVNPKKKYILFVSSNYIRKQKRYDKFLAVVKHLQKWDNQIEPIELINTDRDLVPYYFNLASLHLVTSDFEGSPNSVKEALSCNVPVVSTNVGNVKELLSGANNSFVSAEGTVDELISLCKKSLQSIKTKNERESLIFQGIDIESVALKLKDIYSAAIKFHQEKK